jgi:O-antigen ligase
MGPVISHEWVPACRLLATAERADPRGHAIHVCVALLWASLQAVTNAGEGISWGLLVAITILRLPRIWWCYAPVFRDLLWWTLVAWFAWSSLSCLWGPDAQPAVVSGMPDRWLLTPLLVWPVMGRPWLLLGAMAAGGAAHASVALVMSWTGSGWGTYVSFRGLSHLNTMQWQFLGPFVACGIGLRWLRGPMRLAAGGGWLATGLCVWLMAFRNGLVAALAAAAVTWLRPPRMWRVPWPIRGGLALLVPIVVAWAAMGSPAGQRMEDGLAATSSERPSGLADPALRAVSGGRAGLLAAAWDIGREHPWLGGGAGCFAVSYPPWLLARLTRDGVPLERFESELAGQIIHVHSTLVHEWVDGGIPSVLLLGGFLGGLAYRLWRQSSASACAGAGMALFTLVLLHVPLGIVTLKGPGALMAICLAFSWLGADPSDDRLSAVSPGSRVRR